jgi:hypothetical protein
MLDLRQICRNFATRLRRDVAHFSQFLVLLFFDIGGRMRNVKGGKAKIREQWENHDGILQE